MDDGLENIWEEEEFIADDIADQQENTYIEISVHALSGNVVYNIIKLVGFNKIVNSYK